MKAKMNKWSGWTNETRPDILMALYRHKLVESGFTIRDESYCFFEPYGFTALFLLSESHFAIHTFPEEKRPIWNYHPALMCHLKNLSQT